MAQTYDFVVIDIGASLGQLTRASVESSTLTLLVTSGEITSVRNAATALQRFEQWQIPTDHYKLIFNQRSRSDGMNAEELSAAVDRDIFWQVPYDQRISASVQMGQPAVLFDDSATGAKSLLSLARTIAGTKKPLVQQKKKSLMQRLNKR
jgi:Flp pilus assembly CpaE family ATPase